MTASGEAESERREAQTRAAEERRLADRAERLRDELVGRDVWREQLGPGVALDPAAAATARDHRCAGSTENERGSGPHPIADDPSTLTYATLAEAVPNVSFTSPRPIRMTQGVQIFAAKVGREGRA